MSLGFEFHAFPGEAMGDEVITVVRVSTDQAARQRAGRLSIKINGPVDIVRIGDEPYDERYLTTALPNHYNQSGYGFERLT